MVCYNNYITLVKIVITFQENKQNLNMGEILGFFL